MGDTAAFQLGTATNETTMPLPGLSKPKPAPKVTPLEDLVGQKIAMFEIQKKLAVGHTGMVFRANDTEHNPRWPSRSSGRRPRPTNRRCSGSSAMKTMMPIRHENIVQLHAAARRARIAGWPWNTSKARASRR